MTPKQLFQGLAAVTVVVSLMMVAVYWYARFLIWLDLPAWASLAACVPAAVVLTGLMMWAAGALDRRSAPKVEPNPAIRMAEALGAPTACPGCGSRVLDHHWTVEYPDGTRESRWSCGAGCGWSQAIHVDRNITAWYRRP